MSLQDSPGRQPIVIAVLVVIAALLIAQIYSLVSIRTLNDRVAAIAADNVKSHDWVTGELNRLQTAATAEANTQQQDVTAIRSELDKARLQVGRARVDASKSADDLAAKIAAEEASRQQQQQQVASQMSTLAENTNSAHAKIADVSNNLNNVKTEADSTKAELDKTISDLHKAVGDMGVMSGLIATNSKELSALKELGDRNYFEFTLAKTKQPQKVGDIAVQLRKTNVGKNQYTIDVVAEDKKFQKKDRTINEPVQFYVSRSKQPYEIVVNSVEKDKIVGYLATPKVQTSRP